MNRASLLGYLGADSDFRSTNSGSVLRLRLATTETYLDRDKVRQEKTEWHSCVIFGARAEALHAILTKGKQVYIDGSLRTSSYEDKDGVKRTKTEIVVDKLELCGGGNRPASDRASAPSRTRPADGPGDRPDQSEADETRAPDRHGGDWPDDLPFGSSR